MKENKKIVNKVSNVVSQTAEELAVLKAKGQRVIRRMKKRWDAGASKRELLRMKAATMIKKIERNGKSVIGTPMQFGKDVIKGVKRGMKK